MSTAEYPADSRSATGLVSGRAIVGRLGIVGFLVFSILIFHLLRPETFLTYRNLTGVLTQMAVVGMLAAGLTICLSAGEFDLSIGATFGLSAIVCATLLARNDWSLPAVLLVAISIGIAAGLVNAFLVGVLRISSFIATLGTASLFTGVNYLYSGRQAVHGLPMSFLDFMNQRILGIPLPAILLVGLCGIVWGIQERTALGRALYAKGHNALAARLSGLPMGRLTAAAFIASGVTAAIAAVIFTGRAGVGEPAAGPGFLLPAYAACFLGASTLRLGEFHILGTFIGAALIGVLNNGLNQLNAPLFADSLVQGFALLAALLLVRLDPATEELD